MPFGPVLLLRAYILCIAAIHTPFPAFPSTPVYRFSVSAASAWQPVPQFTVPTATTAAYAHLLCRSAAHLPLLAAHYCSNVQPAPAGHGIARSPAFTQLTPPAALPRTSVLRWPWFACGGTTPPPWRCTRTERFASSKRLLLPALPVLGSGSDLRTHTLPPLPYDCGKTCGSLPITLVSATLPAACRLTPPLPHCLSGFPRLGSCCRVPPCALYLAVPALYSNACVMTYWFILYLPLLQRFHPTQFDACLLYAFGLVRWILATPYLRHYLPRSVLVQTCIFWFFPALRSACRLPANPSPLLGAITVWQSSVRIQPQHFGIHPGWRKAYRLDTALPPCAGLGMAVGAGFTVLIPPCLVKHLYLPSQRLYCLVNMEPPAVGRRPVPWLRSLLVAFFVPVPDLPSSFIWRHPLWLVSCNTVHLDGSVFTLLRFCQQYYPISAPTCVPDNRQTELPCSPTFTSCCRTPVPLGAVTQRSPTTNPPRYCQRVCRYAAVTAPAQRYSVSSSDSPCRHQVHHVLRFGRFPDDCLPRVHCFMHPFRFLRFHDCLPVIDCPLV